MTACAPKYTKPSRWALRSETENGPRPESLRGSARDTEKALPSEMENGPRPESLRGSAREGAVPSEGVEMESGPGPESLRGSARDDQAPWERQPWHL